MKELHLELYRNYFRKDYIIGKLFIGDDYFCDTLEPSFHDEHPCIPANKYVLDMNTISPKYHKRHPYNTLCKGKVPRLYNVPGRDGILIHIGNFPIDTKGCILVGQNTQRGVVLKSTQTFTKLYKILKQYKSITINIVNIPLDNYGYNN